jgi:predicted rRNA methylase YqxC with S4 and FtsJ domains
MNFELRFEVFHTVSEGIHKHLLFEKIINEALEKVSIDVSFISIMRISPFLLDAPLKSYSKKWNRFIVSNQLDYESYLKSNDIDRFGMIKKAILETIETGKNISSENKRSVLNGLCDILNNIEFKLDDIKS